MQLSRNIFFLMSVFAVLVTNNWAPAQTTESATQPTSTEVETPSEEPRDPAEIEADVKSFDQVWITVRDKNWDDEFDFDAWDKVRAELRPRVEKSESIIETRQIIGEMLESLAKSHYGILPRETYDKIKSAKEEKAEQEDEDDDEEEEDGVAGLRMRLVEGQPVVTRVEPGSAAADAGIQAGWVLKKYKDRDVTTLYEELKKELPPTSPVRADTIVALALEGKLEGDVGESVELLFLDAEDQEAPVTVTYKQQSGNRVAFGHLPEMTVQSRSENLPGGIGYVWFNLFFDPTNVMNNVNQAVDAARDGHGMVIDLRGNRGGLGGMTMGVGGFFVSDEKSYLGTLSTKDTDLKFVLFPRANAYDGPVAVLVDECSISSAEILAGGLQAIERAKIFGVRTAGAALPSTVEKLPNEDRFQYAIAGYTDSQGRNIEGNGVVPDNAVALTRVALLDGHDEILDAAIEWINSQNK